MIDEIKESISEYTTVLYNSTIENSPKIIVSIILITVLWLITIIVKKIFQAKIYTKLKDPLIAKFIVRIIRWAILSVGVIICLKILGLGNLLIGIFSGAGVAALVLGFAFKDIGENFIAGILMLFNRPFKQGDLIQLGDQKGRVHTIGLRETVIKTYDGKDVFIPNANILKGNLINETVDGFLRFEFSLGLDYGSDIERTFTIILETIKSIDGVLSTPEPKVYVDSFGESTINIQYTLWINLFDPSIDRFLVRSHGFYKVWDKLTENNVSMPGKIIELKNYTESFPITIKTND